MIGTVLSNDLIKMTEIFEGYYRISRDAVDPMGGVVNCLEISRQPALDH